MIEQLKKKLFKRIDWLLENRLKKGSGSYIFIKYIKDNFDVIYIKSTKQIITDTNITIGYSYNVIKRYLPEFENIKVVKFISKYSMKEGK